MDHMGILYFTGLFAKIILKIRRLQLFSGTPATNMYNSIFIVDTIMRKGGYWSHGYCGKSI